ncbi:VOC family protein [Aquibacillus kalidii]|uniref:VOC family protein n=1 Tax=Aquibacillus kalidii TaxID=2762597 RepID=UPI0016468299|nr:VOC family protein [Aquibacillus kalidii]
MNPISAKINGVFVPVSNIESARDWYCDLLGLPADGEIFFGHIYVLPLTGTNIILDSKIYSPDNVYNIPALQLHTESIKQAYEFMRKKKVELVTEIENGHWFNFKDPDGNLIMVCE